MNDSSSRGLDELRALLATYGPVEVLEAFSVLCNEAATLNGAAGEGVELWECAARAAHEAAASLSGEEDADEAEGEALTEDAEAAAEEGDELEADALDDEESPDEPSEATAASPAEDTGQTTPTAAQIHEDTTMAKDSRLGPRPAGASSWRCKRADGKRRTGTPLLWDHDGVAVEEWPIRVCSADTILDRWGPGSYVIQYIHEENGKRRPCGTSRVLHISGRKDGAAAVATELAAAQASAAMQAPPSAAPPIQATFLPPSMPMAGGDPMFANVFALMTFMNDQNERARASAAAEAKIAMERYRADQDAQLERERIASQERIALAMAQANLQAKTVRATGPLDPDALAAKIGEAVGAKLQEQRDEEEEYEEAPAAPAPVPAAPPPPQDAFSKLIDMLGPVVPLVVTHFQAQAAAAATAAQERAVDHAAE